MLLSKIVVVIEGRKLKIRIVMFVIVCRRRRSVIFVAAGKVLNRWSRMNHSCRVKVFPNVTMFINAPAVFVLAPAPPGMKPSLF